MSLPFLDQTTQEESFFFFEYAKRRFEMSEYNNGQIECAIEDIKPAAKDFFKSDIPEGMLLDLIGDAISFHEANKNGCIYNPAFEGAESFIRYICSALDIDSFVQITNIFAVSAAYLPYPCDMTDAIIHFEDQKPVPTTFKYLGRYDDNKTKTLIKKLHTFNKLIKFSESGNYQKKKIENLLYKDSYLKEYRSTLYSIFYKSTGLLMYDLYICNDYNIRQTISEHRKLDKKIKCDPQYNNILSGNCIDCDYYSRCAATWKKRLKEAVEKISHQKNIDEYTNKMKCKNNIKYLVRQQINFADYEFNGTVQLL